VQDILSGKQRLGATRSELCSKTYRRYVSMAQKNGR
jgi:hypothetical protein